MSKFKSLASLALFAGFASAIWPVPESYKHGDTVIWLSDDVSMTFEKPQEVSNLP